MDKLSRSEQSRVNGAKSHGPNTLKGKIRSSHNAIKTGRYAKNPILLSTEDPAAWDDHVVNYVRRLRPACPVEHHLVEEIASIDWRLVRVIAMDTRILDREMEIQAPANAAAGIDFPPLTKTTEAAAALVDRSRFPDYLARREQQLLRARAQTMRALKDLRKSFPVAEPCEEIISPQPLDPELEANRPVEKEPEIIPAASPKSTPSINQNVSEPVRQAKIQPVRDFLPPNKPQPIPKAA